MKRIGGTLIILGILASCGGSDDDAADTTVSMTTTPATTTTATVPAPTKPPTSTIQASTTIVATTAAPPTTAATTAPPTTAPSSGLSGLVWESAVDPARVNTSTDQPVFEVGEVTGRLQMVLNIDPATAPAGRIRDECQAELDANGRPNATTCTYAQAVFDVGAVEDDVQVAFNSMVDASGIQSDMFGFTDAYGGTVDNLVGSYASVPAPGGTLRLDVTARSFGDTVAFEIPAEAEFQPVDFAD